MDHEPVMPQLRFGEPDQPDTQVPDTELVPAYATGHVASPNVLAGQVISRARRVRILL